MARELLYKKAETEMRRRIVEGDWPVGMRLGNEFQLADEFKVSQGTMRRALMSLEAEGLLTRKPGRGTSVAAAQASVAISDPGQLRRPDGSFPPFEIHRAKTSVRSAKDEEAALFGDTRLHHAERLLKIGGERAALEEVVLPVEITDEFDEEASVDLAEALRDHGLSPAGLEDAFKRAAYLHER